MSRFFRRRKPAPQAQTVTLADIQTAHAWGLTLTQWQGMTDHERAEARRTVTTAPRFMNNRDELAAIIKREYVRAVDRKRIGDVYDAPADAILAAGYSRPRTVSTVAELDALPIGSVVLSESYTHYLDGMRIAFQKWNDESWHRYGRAGDTHPDNFLPASVLYEPEGK